MKAPPGQPVPLKVSTPRRGMLFAEKSFGLYFVLWGLLLQLDAFIPLSPNGAFLFELRCYAPSWLWGGGMLAIGIGRWLAYRAHSARWRLALSLATVVVLWLVAGVAVWAGLIGATAPLACFVALLAQGFHRMLAGDIAKGL